jgi:hypothetical protein
LLTTADTNRDGDSLYLLIAAACDVLKICPSLELEYLVERAKERMATRIISSDDRTDGSDSYTVQSRHSLSSASHQIQDLRSKSITLVGPTGSKLQTEVALGILFVAHKMTYLHYQLTNYRVC